MAPQSKKNSNKKPLTKPILNHPKNSLYVVMLLLEFKNDL
jgi:hypothetical protein